MVVDLKIITKILRHVEAYYIQKNNFLLDGTGYALNLLMPAESSGIMRYSWIISARKFDAESEMKLIDGFFDFIDKKLSIEEYSSIARINIINSSSPLVRNLSTLPRVSQDIIQLNNVAIGNTDLNGALLIRSSVLAGLKNNQIVMITLVTGKILTANIIAIDKKFKLKYYTEKGIKAIVSPEGFERSKTAELKEKSDDFLINNNYMGYLDLFEIKDIVFLRLINFSR